MIELPTLLLANKFIIYVFEIFAFKISLEYTYNDT